MKIELSDYNEGWNRVASTARVPFMDTSAQLPSRKRQKTPLYGQFFAGPEKAAPEEVQE